MMFIDTLYDGITQSTETLVGTVVQGITVLITPMLAAGMLLYIAYIAYQIILTQNEVIIGEVVKMIFLISLATFFIGSGGAYVNNVVPLVQGLPEALASAATGNADEAKSVATQFWQAFDPAYEAISRETTEYNWYDVALWVKAGFFWLLLLICQIIITFTVIVNLIITKVLMTIVLCVGPIFFAFACFPATRNFLNLWIGQAFNYALLNFFYVLVAKIVCTFLTKEIEKMNDYAAIFSLSVSILVMSIVIVTLLGQLGGLAQGLAGGVSAGHSGGLGSMAGKGIRGLESAKRLGAGSMAKKFGGTAGKVFAKLKNSLGG